MRHKGMELERYENAETEKESFYLPSVLVKNLEVYCALRKEYKQDVAAKAIAEFLKEEGINPYRLPKRL